jgi:uncharacterized protein (TIGR02594 family)
VAEVTFLQTSLYDVAKRLAVDEIEGPKHAPLIQYGFALCEGYDGDTPDEVPWCSAWLQVPCEVLGLPRSKSAAARSWLKVGRPVSFSEAEVGNDVVILKRGKAPQPGPNVIGAQGHVGVFAGLSGGRVLVLGGNQSDSVNVRPFDAADVLGVRRLA